MRNIQIINPIEYPNWDDLLLTNPDSTFFHTAAWARVLHESYRYQPLYFTIIENGKLSSLIPIMEIKSFITGKRGVSLPFTDECTPIFKDENHYKAVTETLMHHGKKAGWKHIEFRGENKFLKGFSAYTHHFVHTLALAKNETKIFSSFKSNVRRNIKKAQKKSVKFVLSNAWTAMCDFCRLNCITRKEHGLPPQPLSFFRKIYDHIIAPQHGFVALALYQAKPVAGAVYFHHAGKAIYKYGSSDPKYRKLRPNNLVMWEAIKEYSRNGYKTFSFGRTEPENQGLLQFKRGWGTEEKILNYYKYDLRKGCFVERQPGFKSSYNFFKIMPSPLLRFTGNLLYRHVG